MAAQSKTPRRRKAARADPAPVATATWAERVADRSPVVQRSRDRGVEQATSIVGAARRLIESKGPSFTTNELIKEAGIALQTFYRYFPGKDSLMLAVIENIIDENCAAFREEARRLPEHFRLQTLYPAEVSRATQHYTDLLVEEIRDAMAAGRVHPSDPEYSAWLITQLTMAVFHHYDCAGLDEPADRIAERLWEFCLGALQGPPPAGVRSQSPRRTAKARREGNAGKAGAPSTRAHLRDGRV